MVCNELGLAGSDGCSGVRVFVVALTGLGFRVWGLVFGVWGLGFRATSI